MTMKTTHQTGKNQKFSRKVLEESVQDNWTINFTLKTLSVIHLASSLSQWELSDFGLCDKISKVTNNTKISKNIQNFFEILCRWSHITNSSKINPPARLFLVAAEKKASPVKTGTDIQFTGKVFDWLIFKKVFEKIFLKS